MKIEVGTYVTYEGSEWVIAYVSKDLTTTQGNPAFLIPRRTEKSIECTWISDENEVSFGFYDKNSSYAKIDKIKALIHDILEFKSCKYPLSSLAIYERLRQEKLKLEPLVFYQQTLQNLANEVLNILEGNEY